MVQCVCEWYISGRDRDKTGVLCAASAFLKDFGDFPIYCYEEKESDELCDLYSSASVQLPKWVIQLLKVIDVESFKAGHVSDFDVRSRIVDLLIFLYIRSYILIDQHLALQGRECNDDYFKTTWAATKSTTTVLLKPMLCNSDIKILDSSNIFQSVSKVLWHTLSLSEEAGEHQTSACLLHRLHSRNSVESSSDVESIIVTDLTSTDKSRCSEACRRFRKLWTLTRSSVNENVYDGIPYKSFNKVIMVLLGTIADDSLNGRNSSLKTVATAWFIDCAKHGDLPRIFQMLGTMLLNPSTSRVSIQYMTIDSRLTKETIKSMPSDINCLSLVTANGRQVFQHVLHDAATAQDFTPLAPIDCTKNSAWISDLKKHIYTPPTPNNTFSDTLKVVQQTPAPIKSHKRTISDIPQFDEDNESIGEISVELANADPDVVDCVAFLINKVCDEIEDSEYVKERFKQAARGLNIAESSADLPSVNKFFQPIGGSPTFQREIQKDPSHYRRSLPAALPSSNQNNSVDKQIDEQSKSLLIESNSITSKAPSQPPLHLSDNIKRVKCGHRRQDSLQESIFSTPTQDLRLFDPSELPKLTAPGDDKQPLLEEAQAHMLLYMESPNTVDLGRSEMIFRILSSLLRSNRGAALGKMMVHCMVFNNTSTSPQSAGGGVNQLVEYLNRHYKAIQGEDFWLKPDTLAEGSKPRHCSYFELFCTISLHYLRSYFLNSPISPVSENDITTSWDCKIAALDFFTDLIREIIVMISDIKSRDFVNSVLTVYRQTKLQRCLISFLLTAVPTPRTPTDV
uniref:Telomere length regulation protein TEL2 homolog n=1 Tax=Panagrolaimus davidi TaxID=227884 RepID=A0A914Q1A8_9BILA